MSARPARTRTLSALTAVGLVAALGLAAPASAAPPGPVLLEGGLIVPLQLAAGPGGKALYVNDAAADGSVLRVDLRHGRATETVAAGIGASGIALQGQQVHVVRTAGGDGSMEQSPTYLSKITPRGAVVDLADLLAYERANNPDGQPPGMDAESNPYDLLAYRGGFIVVDAGANALLRVAPNGNLSTLTALPLITEGACAAAPNQGGLLGCDPVPTGLALGPDGFLYVSGLGSEVVGQLWKIDPRTGKIVASIGAGIPRPPTAQGGPVGFTDVAVAADGSIHVSSLFTDQVLRLSRGTWTSATIAAPTGLLWLDGTLYVASAPAVTGGNPLAGGVYTLAAGAFS